VPRKAVILKSGPGRGILPRVTDRPALRDIAAVALGGVLGSLARFGIHEALRESSDVFPTGTLIVNVLGCLAIGLLAPLLIGRRAAWRPFLVVGVLGGFTTFSAFALETVVLLDAGEVIAAGAYVVLTMVAGLLAVSLGAALARRLPPVGERG